MESSLSANRQGQPGKRGTRRQGVFHEKSTCNVDPPAIFGWSLIRFSKRGANSK